MGVKKRIGFGLLSILALALTLTGCGGGGDNNANNSTHTPSTPLITQGLVGYYSFNNGAATVAGGTAANGVTTNVTATTDRFNTNQALHFNGLDGQLVIPSVPFSGNAVTIAFWVKTNMFTNVHYIITWGGGTGKIGIGTNGQTPFMAISNPSTESASATSQIAADTWTHVAATYDGTQIKVFFNGQLQGTHPRTATLALNGMDLTIGVFNTTYWEGSLDDLYIFNRVLSDSEIGQLAHQ